METLQRLQQLLPQDLPISLQVIAATLATLFLGFLYSLITKDRPFAGFPLISVDGKSPRESFIFNGVKTVAEGMQKFSGPFQVMSSTGPKIVLPNRFADELRSHPSLDFNKAFSEDFPTSYPGFEPHKLGFENNTNAIISEVIKTKLTQSLGLITDDLVEETSLAVADNLGDSDEWQTFKIRDVIAEVVTRLSSRVFLGKELCRNERWLQIAKTYAIDSFATAFLMRAAPPFMRPITYWLLPQTARLRKALRDAHALIDPEVERRKAAVEAALAAGEKPPKTSDTIGWMYEIARARGLDLDYTSLQLLLTNAAIHTTTEATCQALLDICEYPEVVEDLRKEIIEVLGAEGWAKASLYKLKLMDSFLREGQRFRPINSVSMHRYIEKKVTLSDGTVLPRGSRVVVAGGFADPETYEDPGRFDAARFLRMRERPGQQSGWQFVATSPAHLLFGHGQHACPGRFFASNEVKITLCHLLIRYDWRFVPGEGRPAPRLFEAGRSVDAESRVQARRRVPEIDLDNL